MLALLALRVRFERNPDVKAFAQCAARNCRDEAIECVAAYGVPKARAVAALIKPKALKTYLLGMSFPWIYDLPEAKLLTAAQNHRQNHRR